MVLRVNYISTKCCIIWIKALKVFKKKSMNSQFVLPFGTWKHESQWNSSLETLKKWKVHWEKKERKETYPLLIRIHISDTKVVFLQQVEVVTDEVKQILSLRITLKKREEPEIQQACLSMWNHSFQRVWTLSREKIQQRKATVLSSNARSNSCWQNVPQI